MSTNLTTTIILRDNRNWDAHDGGAAELRFIRKADRGLRVNGAFAKNDRHGGILFSEDDAIMLRDWLNDEWPVEQRDPLWGGTDWRDYPWRGCACSKCQEARRNG